MPRHSKTRIIPIELIGYDDFKSHYVKNLTQLFEKEPIWNEGYSEIYKKICQYFYGHKDSELDLNKGLCLMGIPGSGKTVALFAMQKMLSRMYGEFNHFHWTTAQNIVTDALKGIDILTELGENYDKNHPSGRNSTPYWFNLAIDDLGTETLSIQLFGSTLYPTSELLQKRCEGLKTAQKLTHITTNLNKNDILQNYGERIASRFEEMFQVIVFPKKDLRQIK